MSGAGWTPSEVAEKVATDNNNPDMKGWLRVYAEVIQRSGFQIVRTDDL